MIIKEYDNGIKIEVYQYGKSMYGGWYCNFRYIDNPYHDSQYDGHHAKTEQDIANWCKVSKTALRRDVSRYDN